MEIKIPQAALGGSPFEWLRVPVRLPADRDLAASGRRAFPPSLHENECWMSTRNQSVDHTKHHHDRTGGGTGYRGLERTGP